MTSCFLNWGNVPEQESSFISEELVLREGEVMLVTKDRESRPLLQTTFAFLIKLAHMIPIIFPSSPRAAGHGVG